jgi:peptide deformylase
MSKVLREFSIIKYGDPILESRLCQPVKNFGEQLEEITDGMFACMYGAEGIGLAAPQVGLSLRLAVIDVTGGKDPKARLILANPKVVGAKGRGSRQQEGCLSLPGFHDYVTRPEFITVQAENSKGEPFEIAGEGILARALCYEIDHLNGTLFIHHLSPLKRDILKRKIRKLRKAGQW